MAKFEEIERLDTNDPSYADRIRAAVAEGKKELMEQGLDLIEISPVAGSLSAQDIDPSSGQSGYLVFRKAIGMWKQTAAGVLGTIAITCGLLGGAYSLMALTDVGQIGTSIWWTLLGTVLLCLLTLGAFWLGADFVKFAFTGRPLSVPPRLRAIGLGLLSFFPGFLIGFLFTACYELPRSANDPQAPLSIFAIGAGIGLASVLAISTFLLKRARAR